MQSDFKVLGPDPSQFNHPFRYSGAAELALGLSGKDKISTRSSNGHRVTLYRANAHSNLLVKYPSGKRVAHPKID